MFAAVRHVSSPLLRSPRESAKCRARPLATVLVVVKIVVSRRGDNATTGTAQGSYYSLISSRLQLGCASLNAGAVR